MKIADFGLAKRLDDDSGRTRTGQVMGTPSYMAPEQASGSARSVGPAADIYALGAILYVFLTGRPPFLAASAVETIYQVVHDEPVPPARLNPQTPRDLETIALKCLEKDSKKRYASAEALADDLRRYLDGRPVLARPTPAWEAAWKWARRRPAAAALAAVSAVTVLALGALATGLVYNARLEQSLADTQRAKALAESYRYFHQIALAHAELRDHNAAQAERYLADCPPEQRHWEWYYLQRLCQYHPLDFGNDGGAALAVALSPDGLRVLSAGQDGAVRVRDLGGGRETQAISVTREGGNLAAFTSDGTLAAVADTRWGIFLLALPDGRRLPMADTHPGCLALSPDGRRLASSGKGIGIRLWDVPTGRGFELCKVEAAAVTALAFSPDGTRLAAASSNPDAIHIWDLVAGRPHLTLKGQYYPVNSLAFSPDGARLASAGTDWTVRVWSVEAGRVLLTMRGHTDQVLATAFSPDGSRVASAGLDRTVRVWDAATGQPLLTLLGHRDGVQGLAFSPGGALLVSADRSGAVKAWDLTTAQEARTVAAHADSANGLAFSPDGARLVTGGHDRAVTVLDVATGQPLATLQGHTDRVWGVAYHPRAERAASIALNGELRLWDVAAGRLLASVRADATAGRGVAYSPDGTRLATTGWDGTVKVWDEASAELLASLPCKAHGECVAFSSDGKQLAVGCGDGAVRMWSEATWPRERTWVGGGGQVRGLAFRPDGRALAAADASGTVTIWDLATGQPAGRLHDHTSAVFGLAFTPDGSRLASAGADGTVRLWDVASGQKLLTLAGHYQEVFGLAFSPDGTRLASAGRDGTVKLWDARPDSAATAAERTAVGLVADLFARPLRRDDVLTLLNDTPALSPRVRDVARALAGRYREEARPARYAGAARAALRWPGQAAERYRLALLQAETAVKLSPLIPAYRIVLGAAQYRVGRYGDALATLNGVDRLVPGVPQNLALLAMTHQHLGHPDLARDYLEKARKALEQPVWAKRPDADEARELCRQAAELLNGSTTSVSPGPAP